MKRYVFGASSSVNVPIFINVLSKCSICPASGETKVIGLTYNPNNHPGTIDANAFVYLSLSDEKPVARLTLRGNVLPGADEWARYPYIMGKLRLKQNRMEFKISGKRLSERILCGNSGAPGNISPD